MALRPASDRGVGAVLLQERDGLLRPVQYASRKLSTREDEYSIVEKEALAIVFGVKTFSSFLLLRPLSIQTDHKSLAFINKNQFHNARVMRWDLLLQQYSFSVESIPGSQNCFADVLSRMGS